MALAHASETLLAIGGAAVRAREATAGLEVNVQIEPFFVSMEVHSLDHPRQHQAKSELKEVCVTHRTWAFAEKWVRVTRIGMTPVLMARLRA
jgi:hypothetical protein